MASRNRDAWCEIVAGYLHALYVDARARRESSLKNSQEEFLRRFGAANVHRDYLLVARTRLASLLPPPDRSDGLVPNPDTLFPANPLTAQR